MKPKPEESSQTPPPWDETRVIGERVPRVDAYERVSGSATYTLDLTFPDMLHAVILRCPHAHARVKNVDTSRAERMPGVHAVLTKAEPEASLPWYFQGDRPTSALFDSHCRYAGDEVAAVAAEDPYQAREAARAIQVDYEVLPFVVEFEKALDPGAPRIHDSGNQVKDTNISERGDIEAGLAEADVVLEETFETPCELHTPMETFVSIARWDGDELTVWDSSQGVFAEQEALARYFRLPLSSVRVISRYMGGGFGSKLDLGKYTVIAALLARTTGRSVKLALSREESFLSEGNRPANRITLKAGIKKDGTLTALHGVFLGPVGAYPESSTSAFLLRDLYLCPNVRTEETDVYINAGKARPMRAPGFPSCAWALEQMMDALAERIGMDPVELRLKNIPDVSQTFGNQPYTSTGLKQCLTEGAAAFGWDAARKRARKTGPICRGVGMAAAMWGYPGEPRSTIIIKLLADGSANLNMGAADIGTGTKTVMAMVVAEELGVPLDRIQIEYADTGTTQYAPVSGGSQTVLASAPAVRAAALEVKHQILEIASAELQRPASELVLVDGRVTPKDDPDGGMLLSGLKGLQQRQVLVGVGRRDPFPEGKVPLPFAAQFAEVEVNTRTGETRVVRLVAAHDSGRVMNRLTYENQVFGGMTMGIGFGLTEQRVLDPQTGRVVNANWHDYKIPTALDVPAENTCLPIDPHDKECNTAGVKGLGEPATIPTAAAIANAFYHATGIRITRSPMTPRQVLEGLAPHRTRS